MQHVNQCNMSNNVICQSHVSIITMGLYPYFSARIIKGSHLMGNN